MARFLSESIEHPKTGRAYQVELNIEELGALNENLEISIQARAADNEREAITATLTIDLAAEEITIKVEDMVVGRIPLNTPAISEEDSADDNPESTGEAVLEAIERELRDGGSIADAVERIIEAMPVPDPALGCLLRGALSAVIPTIIRCYFERVRFVQGLRQKALAMAACLGNRVWGMLGKATLRALKCMALLGGSALGFGV